jgi:hypothetical protein
VLQLLGREVDGTLLILSRVWLSYQQH